MNAHVTKQYAEHVYTVDIGLVMFIIIMIKLINCNNTIIITLNLYTIYIFSGILNLFIII